MKARRIALGVTLTALIGAAGAYGGLVWWPQHQAKAAETHADALFDYLRKVTTDLNTGDVQYSKGDVVYAPVTFTLPQSEPQPSVKAAIARLTVTPDGISTITQARFTITTPEGDLTVAAEDSTLTAFEVQDGIPLHLAGTISRPSLAGASVEKLKRHRAIIDLFLANAPAAVQAIPDQVLASVGNLTMSADLRYDPAREHLAYAGGYDLPGLVGIDVAFAAGAVTADAMKSINILRDPALKPLENPALAELSKGAAISHLAQQGELENITLSLTDKGLLNSAVQIYGGFTKLPEADARSKLVEMVNQYPVESLLKEPTPEALQVLADARAALTTLLRGEASRLVIEARPRDQARLDAMEQQLATLNDMAAALDIDVSARK